MDKKRDKMKKRKKVEINHTTVATTLA